MPLYTYHLYQYLKIPFEITFNLKIRWGESGSANSGPCTQVHHSLVFPGPPVLRKRCMDSCKLLTEIALSNLVQSHLHYWRVEMQRFKIILDQYTRKLFNSLTLPCNLLLANNTGEKGKTHRGARRLWQTDLWLWHRPNTAELCSGVQLSGEASVSPAQHGTSVFLWDLCCDWMGKR